MVETSDREDRLELISRLEGHAAVAAAIEEIAYLRERYEKNLGRTLIESSQEVSQREIDYKRGYFRGMLWAYTALIRTAGPELERLLVKELEEGDAE